MMRKKWMIFGSVRLVNINKNDIYFYFDDCSADIWELWYNASNIGITAHTGAT